MKYKKNPEELCAMQKAKKLLFTHLHEEDFRFDYEKKADDRTDPGKAWQIQRGANSLLFGRWSSYFDTMREKIQNGNSNVQLSNPLATNNELQNKFR